MHDMVERVAGPIVCGEFGHEESPWGLVMNDMRAEMRGEHVIQSFADGANGWLIWEVSPKLSFCTMGVTMGSRCRRTFCTIGVTIGSGCALQVVAAGGFGLLGSCGPSLARIEFDN